MREYNVGDVFKVSDHGTSYYEITYIRPSDERFNIHQVDPITHERYKINPHGNHFFYWEHNWIIVKPVEIPPIEAFL